MMINCPECKNPVSDQAPACPHCGTPIALKRSESIRKTKKSWSALFLIMFFSGVALIFTHNPDLRAAAGILGGIGFFGWIFTKVASWARND